MSIQTALVFKGFKRILIIIIFSNPSLFNYCDLPDRNIHKFRRCGCRLRHSSLCIDPRNHNFLHERHRLQSPEGRRFEESPHLQRCSGGSRRIVNDILYSDSFRVTRLCEKWSSIGVCVRLLDEHHGGLTANSPPSGHHTRLTSNG